MAVVRLDLIVCEWRNSDWAQRLVSSVFTRIVNSVGTGSPYVPGQNALLQLAH